MTGMTRVCKRVGRAASGALSPSFAARALGNLGSGSPGRLLLPADGGRLADQRLGQLASPGDVELAVRPAEVRGSGLGRDEQLLRYLPVALARRRQPGNAQLAGGQGVAAGDRVAPRLGPRGDELRPGLTRDAPSAPVMRQVEAALQLCPRLRALAGPAQRRTVVGE